VILAIQLHADLRQRAVVDTDTLAWSPSPMAGVELRMLDRCGAEVARATSIVRYAAGSAFERHSQGGGEEILVLDGMVQNEHGNDPAGNWLRDPTRSIRKPSSESGCTIWVKIGHLPVSLGPDGLAWSQSECPPPPCRRSVAGVAEVFPAGSDASIAPRRDAAREVGMQGSNGRLRPFP
jgi:hypothetical protein